VSDQGVLFDRTPPLRAKLLCVGLTVPLVGLVLTFLLAGWNDTREQTILLAVVGVCFSLPALQELQERVQVSRLTARTRYLGVWWEKSLPRNIHFRPAVDLNRYAGIARACLAAPASIGIIDQATGRQVSVIGFDLLAGMPEAEYVAMIERLNRAVEQRDAADEARAGDENRGLRS
jgi:hypothetical protein